MASAPFTYDVRADVQENILYITLAGFSPTAEMQAAGDVIKREARRLRPGFCVTNDVHAFKPASAEAGAATVDAQKFIASRHPKRVIRVVGGAHLAAMQLSRTAREAGYAADTATSVAEAERLALAP